MNPNGGAIALGHPLGVSGTRMTATPLRELKRRGGSVRGRLMRKERPYRRSARTSAPHVTLVSFVRGSVQGT